MADLYNITSDLFAEAKLDFDPQLADFCMTARQVDRTENRDAWTVATSAVFSAKMNERALGEHAAALREAAKASDRHAASLVWATRILAAATIVLVVATFVLAFKP